MNLLMANSAQNQLLQQLRDVHQPQNVDWWPLAWGWWVVIGLIATIALLLIIKALLKKHHYRYVRFAQSELKQIQQDNSSRWLARSQNIMRRLSLCYVDQELVGSMNQAEWIRFLKLTGEQSLSHETVESLKDLPYKPESATIELDKDLVINDIIQWAERLPEHVQSYTKQRQEVQRHV
ncbi:DUF4381 domain-containing protein [Kangiella sp. HD9-110m-PIT-SAG07]|nr:DUF4381 domain-containing protein [Kangiella sp. HD9-110m-PIT-SAG07]